MRAGRIVSKLVLAAMVLVAAGWLTRPDAAPSREAWASAERLSADVRAGRISDCAALAEFASAQGRRVADWNVFIPAGKVNWPVGVPIGLVGVERPVKLEGAASGYCPRFRKGYGPGAPEGTAHDQAHHFAPYYLLGRRVPAFVAERFLQAAERPESWGDLELGRAAIGMGARGSTAGLREELCLSEVGFSGSAALW